MLCANLDVTRVHEAPIQEIGAWSSTDFPTHQFYSLYLSTEIQNEIDEALKQYHEKQKKEGERDQIFPLPSFARDVEHLRRTLTLVVSLC